jgi:hypothetical protein
VDRVDFNETAWFLRFWSRRILVPDLHPAWIREAVPLERPLHG